MTKSAPFLSIKKKEKKINLCSCYAFVIGASNPPVTGPKILVYCPKADTD